jgi:putative membrane-bound dehydrogenase-like protein
MQRWLVVALCLALPCRANTASVDDPAAGTTQVELNGHTFTLPSGFEIELVAGPPLVNRPITASFDDEGGLYVSDSSGSNDKVDKQLAEAPHRVVRLVDSDGDGRFDSSTVYADKLMFPEGTMWLDGSLYVSAPPSIWKFTDTDGDGVADRREEWFPGKTLTGCANDLHGPYAGPDGRVYWAKGAFARQTYERVGKMLRVIPDLPQNIVGKEVPIGDTKPDLDAMKTWSTRASHIFRCRPDGSDLEVVMTGGMDNPVDVAFTTGGERIFTTTFLQHPGGGRRDGLIHAVYGGIYGKDHDPVHEPQHKWTSPELMPPLSHLGAAAPCGLTTYQSDAFGSEYHGNLFACLFNMHKITRHVLEENGSTYSSRDSDFVVSSNLDFHPTDIVEDADGSLIIVDTGGWYKLCCPTSQLHKPDVLGAIYRVRRKGATKVADVRGSKIEWNTLPPRELCRLLGDARPLVRERAIRTLAERRDGSIGELAALVKSRQATASSNTPRGGRTEGGGTTDLAAQSAIWALSRIDHPSAREATRIALADPASPVRQTAIHSVSLWRDAAAVPVLLKMLASDVPQCRRVAAEALGRIGDKAAVPGLLAALAAKSASEPPAAQAPDRFLEHSIAYALIEIGDATGTAAGLAHRDSRVRRCALIAINQMDGGALDAKQVAGLLESPDSDVREAAAWIVSLHADWADALAGYLRQRLSTPPQDAAGQAELTRQLAQFSRSPAIQEFLSLALRNGSETDASHAGNSRTARRIALDAMRDSGLKEMPKAWVGGLGHVLGNGSPELKAAAIAAARSMPAPKDSAADLASALMAVANDPAAPSKDRLNALAAVPGGLASVAPEIFGFLRENLGPDIAVGSRAAAVEVLAKAKLTNKQLETLADALATAGPLEADRLLGAFEQSADTGVGHKLVATLKHAPALSALRPDSIQRSIAKCGPAVHEEAQALYAVMNVDLGKQQARLEELLTDVAKGGDIRRGQAVFMSTKAACASCHQFGYLGGNVGPDLTRIGGVRNERDLLESIAFPSASFVRSYEPVLVATHDGRVVSGILKKDAPDEVVLSVTATETARIARSDIDELRPGTVSVMPSGLDQQLTNQELCDLIAFLKAAK